MHSAVRHFTMATNVELIVYMAAWKAHNGIGVGRLLSREASVGDVRKDHLKTETPIRVERRGRQIDRQTDRQTHTHTHTMDPFTNVCTVRGISRFSSEFMV